MRIKEAFTIDKSSLIRRINHWTLKSVVDTAHESEVVYTYPLSSDMSAHLVFVDDGRGYTIITLTIESASGGYDERVFVRFRTNVPVSFVTEYPEFISDFMKKFTVQKDVVSFLQILDDFIQDIFKTNDPNEMKRFQKYCKSTEKNLAAIAKSLAKKYL